MCNILYSTCRLEYIPFWYISIFCNKKGYKANCVIVLNFIVVSKVVKVHVLYSSLPVIVWPRLKKIKYKEVTLTVIILKHQDATLLMMVHYSILVKRSTNMTRLWNLMMLKLRKYILTICFKILQKIGFNEQWNKVAKNSMYPTANKEPYRKSFLYLLFKAGINYLQLPKKTNTTQPLFNHNIPRHAQLRIGFNDLNSFIWEMMLWKS